MDLKSLIVPTLNLPPAREKLSAEPLQARIPRKIHQKARSKDLPAELEANIAGLKSRNPGWEHRLYDDADAERYLSEHYPSFVLDYHNRIDPAYGAARADLFRYLLLYKEGGFYLDLKSTATRPLDEAIREDDQFLLAQWGDEDVNHVAWGAHHDLTEVPGGEYQQWFIMCAPGHPFLKAVIEAIFRNIDVYMPGLHGVGHYGVIRTTGPIAYTKAIAPIVDSHPHRMVRSFADVGLVYTIYGSQTEHYKLSPRHYTQLTDPLIAVTPGKRFIGEAFGRLRSAWGSTRRLAESVRSF